MGYKTPEELLAEADALLEKHTGKPVGDDEEEPGFVDDEGLSGDELAGEEEPAKEAAKNVTKPKEGEGSPEGSEQGEPATEADKVFDTTGVDEKAANRIKAAQARMHQATQAEAAMRRELADAIMERDRLRQLAQHTAETGTTPTSKETKPVKGMSKERLEQLQKDYPDLADFFQSTYDLQQDNAQMREQLAGVSQDQASTKEQTADQIFISAIKEVHSDVDKIRGSDEWLGWVQQQPHYVQQAVFGKATAMDMIEIISDYKHDMGMPVPGVKEDSTPAEHGAEDEGSGDEPAPQHTSKLEQAQRIATPTLSRAARQHKPGKGEGRIITKAEITARSNDVAFLGSPEGEAWLKEVEEAQLEGRVR